jgi:hypothetical protein
VRACACVCVCGGGGGGHLAQLADCLITLGVHFFESHDGALLGREHLEDVGESHNLSLPLHNVGQHRLALLLLLILLLKGHASAREK